MGTAVADSPAGWPRLPRPVVRPSGPAPPPPIRLLLGLAVISLDAEATGVAVRFSDDGAPPRSPETATVLVLALEGVVGGRGVRATGYAMSCRDPRRGTAGVLPSEALPPRRGVARTPTRRLDTRLFEAAPAVVALATLLPPEALFLLPGARHTRPPVHDGGAGSVASLLPPAIRVGVRPPLGRPPLPSRGSREAETVAGVPRLPRAAGLGSPLPTRPSVVAAWPPETGADTQLRILVREGPLGVRLVAPRVPALVGATVRDVTLGLDTATPPLCGAVSAYF